MFWRICSRNISHGSAVTVGLERLRQGVVHGADRRVSAKVLVHHDPRLERVDSNVRKNSNEARKFTRHRHLHAADADAARDRFDLREDRIRSKRELLGP